MEKRCAATADSLREDLRRAGIDPHGVLLCHLSMKQIGPVDGGPDAVLDALMSYMEDGLLVIPCHTWANVGADNPVFDVLETKPCVGLLPDLFRRRPGVIRTLHPTHSLCMYGKGAEEFAAGQERFDTPCAPGSCYGELERRDAQVMMIGVTFACNTSVHCIEEVARVPNRLSREKQALRVRRADGTEIAVPSFRHENANSDYYVKLEPVMRWRGLLRETSFGAARTLLFREKDLFRVTLGLLARNPDLFGDGAPVPPEWYAEGGASPCG